MCLRITINIIIWYVCMEEELLREYVRHRVFPLPVFLSPLGS